MNVLRQNTQIKQNVLKQGFDIFVFLTWTNLNTIINVLGPVGNNGLEIIVLFLSKLPHFLRNTYL